MKRLFMCLTAMLMTFFIVNISYAKVEALQDAQDFLLKRTVMSQDGTFILIGAKGQVMEAYPYAMSIKDNGELQWEVQPSGAIKDNLYYDVALTQEGDCLALRYAGAESSLSVLDILSNGQIVGEIEGLRNAYLVFPAQDGFILSCKDHFSHWRLERRNIKGDLLWKYELEEPIVLNGIVRQGDNYIAFGGKQEDREGHPKGVLFMLDDVGNLLWRYDGEADEIFLAALDTGDGGIVLAGNTDPSSLASDTSTERIRVFITRFDENELVYRTDYAFEDGGLPRDGYLQSIIETDEGYLIAVKQQQQRFELTFILFNKQGQYLRSWNESTEPLYNPLYVSLLKKGNEIFMVANGRDSDDLKKHITIIKSIYIND